MAKKLMINCGSCDARNVKEETLAAYESITINSGDILVSRESKELLNRYGVTMNCGDVEELDADVQITSVNGSLQIRSSDMPADRCFLTVNGTLDIGPGTQQVLSHYVGIRVNGSVTYPDSVSAFVGMLSVNGSTCCYPDDAIVLKRSAVIDRLFALRAKNSLYWSARRMIMVDPRLDAAVLEEKGATFSSKEVIIAESQVEDMIGLIDEKAEIVIVPDGTAVITDDVTLDELTLKKYGTKLYIIGDLNVDPACGELLAGLEYLNVRGDVSVPQAMKEQLMLALTDISGEVKIAKHPKGRHLGDKMTLRITRWLLEQEPDGISVSDCMRVNLDEEIPPELILERLSFTDCLEIKCSPEQEAAVAAVSEDVMAIGSLGRMVKDTLNTAQETIGSDMGIGDMIKGALGGVKNALDTKVINAGDYVL